MLASFSSDVRADRLDREAFKFGHCLLGHPALALENLAEVLPALPKSQVMYSQRRLANGDDFEATFRHRPIGQSIEQTIDSIRESDAYIMVQSPETHASFGELARALREDVHQLMRQRGLSGAPIDSKLYLFIASPNSVTPFHIDRYSTFLLQFRGSKQVSVFPPWDENVVSAAHREAYVAYASTQLPWSAQIDPLGTCFDFAPGEALHIPFVAGHHVRNGPEDVSISLSIIFNTRQTMAWRRALCFNHASRKLLTRLGMAPRPVGAEAWRDAAKSQLWRVASAGRALLGRRRS